MHQQATASRGPICVARGYGIKIHVLYGHLVVEDGVGYDRRTRRYHRAGSTLERLLLIGHTGYVTLEALRWLRDKHAALLQIDTNGQLLTTSIATGPDLAALRRAQALADTSPTGIEIARDILGTKVAGQRAVLDEIPHDHNAIEPVATALTQIGQADTLQEILLAESQAAEAYWGAWSPLPIPFPPRDREKLPRHWLSFGQRHSLIAQGPRLATNPANAILNVLYALLEAETTLACHAVGLDPGLGIFHTDRRDRASLALDLMEGVRPIVDSYVLAVLTQRTLRARDFVETRQGACRLAPKFAAELAETLPAWRRHVGPIVEQTAHALANSTPTRLPLLTPLTRANHRAAWDDRAPSRRVHRPRSGNLVLPASCRGCGGPVPDRRRRYCDQCRREQSATHVAGGREKAAAVLASLRAEQRDPAHGGHAAHIRGVKNAAHQRAVHAWKGEAPDPAVFAAEILPGLRQRTVPDMVTATGLSQHYCSLIRLGKKVPHPRHWDALRSVAAVGDGDGGVPSTCANAETVPPR
jgi:CRISPR-associated endonuclease Cas1